MIPLVEFPELVEHYAPFFVDVFSAEAFIEFKRYISGLLVSENKTVEVSTGYAFVRNGIKAASIAC